MTLEDKFYPEDGSKLTRFDNFMIKSAGKVGEGYQHLTGKSYKDLVKKCYQISTGGFALSLLGARASALFLGLFSYCGLKEPNFNSPLEEEMEQEARGYSKYIKKIFRLSWMAFIPIFGYLGYNCVDKGLDESSNSLLYLGTGTMVETLSLIPFSLAEYMTKAKIPEPPRKTVGKRIKDKMKEYLHPNPGFKPEPQLQPVPIPVDY
ncbi:hypothetical protein ACFL1H_05210 [Nanoarchaeota archaeon]